MRCWASGGKKVLRKAPMAGVILNPANLATVGRIALLPLLYFTAVGKARELFAGFFIAAAATDVVDGWLARRSGRTSSSGRHLDSLADALFYYSIPIWFWFMRPEIVRQWFPWVFAPLALFLLGIAVKMAKRKFIAAFHLPTTRAAGVVAFAYLIWALWGRPPVAATQLLMALLAVAAFVELYTILHAPDA